MKQNKQQQSCISQQSPRNEYYTKSILTKKAVDDEEFNKFTQQLRHESQESHLNYDISQPKQKKEKHQKVDDPKNDQGSNLTGEILMQRKVQAKNISEIGYKYEESITGIRQQKKDLEKKFEYASFANFKSSDHEQIRKKLLVEKIECVILAPFENVKLKGVSSYSILYHEVPFDRLEQVVGRLLQLFSITNYILLKERNIRNKMSKADFNNIGVRLHKEYPQQTLRMWIFFTDNNDQEFYIQTQSKESSLYIFIAMAKQERLSFKNPKGLKGMGERERQSRFMLMYPTKQ